MIGDHETVSEHSQTRPRMSRPGGPEGGSRLQRAPRTGYHAAVGTTHEGGAGAAGGRALYGLLVAGFVVYGAAFTSFGAAVPLIIGQYHWSYAATGLVLAALSVGFFVANYLCGLYLQTSSAKRIYVAAALACAVILAFFGRSPSPAVNLALSFLVGVSQGVIDLATNFETTRLERPGESRRMNLLHAAFSAGAILGPLAVGALAQMGVEWRGAFAGFAGLFVALGAFAAFARFPGPQPRPREPAGGARLLQEPVLVLLCLIMALYIGTELGASNWIAEYSVRMLGATPAVGAFALSTLWVGMFAGRAFLAFVRVKARPQAMLVGLACLGVASLAGFLAARSLLPAFAAAFAMGVAFSGVFPFVMTITGHTFQSAAAVGLVGTAAGLGSFSLSFLLAAIAQAVGLRWGFWMLVGLLAVCAACALFLTRLLSSPPKGPAPRA
jgi:fucose permease